MQGMRKRRSRRRRKKVPKKGNVHPFSLVLNFIALGPIKCI